MNREGYCTFSIKKGPVAVYTMLAMQMVATPFCNIRTSAPSMGHLMHQAVLIHLQSKARLEAVGCSQERKELND